MSSLKELEAALGAADAALLKAAACGFVFRRPRADEFANAAKRFAKQPPVGEPLKVAVLGDVTTHLITAAMPVVFGSLGLATSCWEASFDTWRMELLDPGSAFSDLAPGIVVLVLSARHVPSPPAFASAEEVEDLAQSFVADLAGMWQAAGGGRETLIIQHNFALPVERSLGRLEPRCPWSRRRFLQRVNTLLWEHEGRGVRILDVESLAARVGEAAWSDPRWHFHSKHAFDPRHIGDYALALRGTLAASLGKSHKVLVTDLDDTLWAGTLGDLGPTAIEIGPGTAKGEAHLHYASYLKSLRERGVILAINSRNTHSVVEQAFAQIPHLPLKLEDFASIHCHWESKSSHLKQIAAELNVGMDSLVVVDDDALQREEIRLHCPEVCVAGFPDDVSYLAQEIDQLQLFDVTALTAEDAGRTASYRAAAHISASTAGPPADLPAFLSGLAMNANCRAAGEPDLERAEALLLKTNQFNLTQKSFARGELKSLTDAGGLVLICDLQDRLTKYGIVSVLVGRPEDGHFRVLNWVMSCRVFSRTLEHYMANWLGAWCVSRGLAEIHGLLNRTPKNKYAQDFIQQHACLGFRQDDAIAWKIDTGHPQTTFVTGMVPVG